MSEDNLNALPVGAMLHEYRIINILGSGGFGITYLASDTKLNMKVAIKEYLPNDLAVRRSNTVLPKSTGDGGDFQWGLDRFLDEAKTLARFNHPNVVQVLRFFEANSTAYMVMRYEDGLPLNEILKTETLTEEELIQNILLPLLDGLKQVHEAGFLHRDIKPGNIYMRRSDETPVLLDFGAARNALGSKSKSLTSIVTAGYAPFEQYHSDGNQGSWSDIYALGAVAYRIVTGKRPPEAPSRIRKDNMISAGDAAKGKYSEKLLTAIDRALAVDEEDRPQNCELWKQELTEKSAKEPLKLKSHEPKRNSEEKTKSLPDERLDDVKPTKKKNTLVIVLGVALLLIVGAIMVPQLSNNATKEIKHVSVDFQLDSKEKKLSYAIGLDIGKSFKDKNININFGAVSKAIVTILNGSDATMTKEDAAKIKQAYFKKEAQKISGNGNSFQFSYDELKKLSYAIGLDVGASLKALNTDIDTEAVLKAIGDVLSGGNKRMMSKKEADKVKKSFFKKQADKRAKEIKASASTNKERGEKFLVENARKSGIHVTRSGLQYEILRKGTGASPKSTDKVTVHYRGMLIDGTEFDSSYKRGQPVTFPLNGVIKGWIEGVQLMKIGAKYRLFIPSVLAYGKRGAGEKISPNSVLIFEIELLGIK